MAGPGLWGRVPPLLRGRPGSRGPAPGGVFYQTSATTVARFRALGAPNATFTPIPGGTPETSVVPVMADVLPWFQSPNQ